jgi:hypothetical protein
LSLVKYDIDHCYFNVKSSLASFQVATALYPDQFSVRNTAIVVEGTTGANLSHFQSAGWTASYSTVAQALTVTGHQSIVDVGGITKIIGANVNVAGAAATFAAGNVGRCIAVIGGAAGGAYGLMFIRAVDATGTNATCDILRPLSTAAISASQWAVVTAMKPAFKNCVFNAPFNKGGFNPFPEPDQDQANVYAIPAGVTASEGQSTVGYAAPDILRGNTVDPLYALPGREVVGTRVQLPVLTL